MTSEDITPHHPSSSSTGTRLQTPTGASLAAGTPLGKLPKFTLELGVFAALLLSLQASAPIEGSPSAPALANWFAFCALNFFLGFLGIKGRRDHQAAALCCLISCLHLLNTSEAWTHPSASLLSSRLASSLSRTWGGVPLVAVAHSWALLCLAWLSTEMLLKISGNSKSTLLRAIAFSLGGIIAIFGVRAVIGYATGNLSLLAI